MNPAPPPDARSRPPAGRRRCAGPAPAVLALLASATALLAGCAGLAGLGGFARPQVSVASTRVTGVSLDAADLEVRFRIDNPNDFGLQLAGLDYQLDVAQRTLFRGDRRERLQIEPRGQGIVELPVTVRYADLYDLVRDLWTDRDRSQVGYTLRAGLTFEAPVVGGLRVPVEARGDLPLRR